MLVNRWKLKLWLKARGSIVGRHLSIHEDNIDPDSFFKEESDSKPLMSALLDMLDIKVKLQLPF